METILKIKNLKTSVNDDISILKGIDLDIKSGEVHVIMGPNGSGKSTLSKVLAGHPMYNIDDGEIIFDNKLINLISAEERSHLGLFLAFQYPLEIPGVSNAEFLRLSYNLKQKYLGKPETDPITFFSIIKEKLKLVNLDVEFLNRNVNEGFSGGEKKRNEILQMSLLGTKLAILDEIDSGLDIDALKSLSEAIVRIKKEEKTSLILITHYKRLLDYIKPDYVHIIKNGKIIKTGDISLVKKLEENGYENYEPILN